MQGWLTLILNSETREMLAEREGFEPPIPVKVCLISSQVHSTGLCHLSAIGLIVFHQPAV